MEDPRVRPVRGCATVVAVAGIAAATVAGLWLLSFFCLSEPTSPLNLSDWECGAWSGFAGVGILLVGVALTVLTWEAIRRKR